MLENKHKAVALCSAVANVVVAKTFLHVPIRVHTIPGDPRFQRRVLAEDQFGSEIAKTSPPAYDQQLLAQRVDPTLF